MSNNETAGLTATELPDGGDGGHQPLSRHTPDDYVLGDRDPTDDIFVAERPWGAFQQFVYFSGTLIALQFTNSGHSSGARAPLEAS